MHNTITLEKLTAENRAHKLKRKKNFTTAARKLIEANGWRFQLYKALYRSKVFSITLLVLILASSSSVILQTVPEYRFLYRYLYTVEWVVTIIFTVEYFLRILAAPRPFRYIFSLVGLIDFIAIFPTYIGLLEIVDVNYLLVVRLVRLFRLFRVFDLIEYTKYTREVRVLVEALKNSQRKISIFILAIVISVTLIGSLMYIIEGEQHGFRSIPQSIYWAIVTITTVGYGDIAPQTPIGQTLASLLMLLGFSTIVVFTSIVGAEIYKKEETKKVSDAKSCLDCGMTGHDTNASYCKYCGGRLWGAN